MIVPQGKMQYQQNIQIQACKGDYSGFCVLYIRSFP